MKKINLFMTSITYAQDVLNITNTYLDTMDFFFSNVDNQITYEFCYKEYLKFSEELKKQARMRGLLK